MTLPPETLAQLEYEALRTQERDYTGTRSQVWASYLTIVAAFVFATGISETGAYAVALCPLLLACLARHARHSEDVLRTIRKYLYQLEKESQYSGYEHFTRTTTRASHGGYRDALRDAFLLTDILSVALVLWRLYTDHATLWLFLPVLLVGAAAMIATMRWLTRPAKPRAS